MWYLECYLKYWKGFNSNKLKPTPSIVYRSKSFWKALKQWWNIYHFYDDIKLRRHTKNDYINDLDDSFRLVKINPSQSELTNKKNNISYRHY